MNTQLAQQEQAPLMAMDEALTALVLAFNHESEINEKRDNENVFLKLQVQNLKVRLSTLSAENEQLVNQRAIDEKAQKALTKQQNMVIASAEKINQKSLQDRREAEQAKNEVKDLKIQLAAYKEIANSPKKIRDKIKDLQSRVVKANGFSEQHKKNFKGASDEIKALKKQIMSLSHKLSVSDIIQLHGDGNHRICLFPHQLGDIGGYESDQVPLLYMHTSGRASLVLLNNDGEAELPPAPKGGLRPSKDVIDHCGQLLRRFKAQGWKLTDSDVASIAMKN